MNTNENQNLNSVVPPTTEPGANVVPPVAPNMDMGPVVNPTPAQPPMPAPAGPAPVPPEAPAPVQTPAAPVPPEPAQSINLQPEGTIAPQVNTPTPTVAEPLMGTPLNDQTLLNPASPAAPGVPPIGPQPAMDPNGGIEPMPNNPGMGGIPTPPAMPNPNEKKNEKKKINPLLIVLVVVLVFAVGFGVYYFLTSSKGASTSAVKITPLLTEVELGSDFIDDITSYAKVEGYNSASCTIDSNVDATEAGTYQYTITCGKVTSGPNTVTVMDTMAPEVLLKDVVVLPNAEITAEDFVDVVNDASNYTIEFEEEPDTSEVGTFDVTIVVADDYENETKEKAKLIVDENAPDYYLSCIDSSAKSSTYETASIEMEYRFGINLDGDFYNSVKKVVYTFEEEEDYYAALEDVTDDGFDKIKGKVKTDDDYLTITIEVDLTLNDLAKEFDEDTFPDYGTDIEDFFADKDIQCDIE